MTTTQVTQAAELALRTFYNYIYALSEEAADGMALLVSQAKLPQYLKLQGNASIDMDDLRSHLYRGWLTLRLIDSLPVDDDPELAVVGNYFVPVQAYYALHGLGISTLMSLGCSVPRGHRAFLAAMARNVVLELLPPPLNIACHGDTSSPTASAVRFANTDVDVPKVKKLSNLSNPQYADRDLLMAKSILTTRSELLRALFDRNRAKGRKKGKTRRNLRPAEKAKIANGLASTTVFDFFYRLRLRSNYDEADMYIFGQEDKGRAQSHYLRVSRLTRTVIALLERIIERKIGASRMQTLRDGFK